MMAMGGMELIFILGLLAGGGSLDIASSLPQREFVQALASVTRALDPSRPVVSNYGWEHVDSDLMTIHDYASDPELIKRRYADEKAVGFVERWRAPGSRRSRAWEERLNHPAATIQGWFNTMTRSAKAVMTTAAAPSVSVSAKSNIGTSIMSRVGV